MKGFEVEYFSDVGTGPRYQVNMEQGEVARDNVFMHGQGPLAGTDVNYPGTQEVAEGDEDLEKAYEQIMHSGLEPGQFYISEEGERNFRVEVYGEGLEEVDNVSEDFVDEAVEELEQLF